MAEPAPSSIITAADDGQPQPGTPPRHRALLFKSKLARIGLAVVLLTVALLWVLRNENNTPKEDITWLTMAETTSPAPGAFTRFKFRILGSSKRLWNLYEAAHKQMSMEASFLSYPEAFPPPMPLSVQTFTNADGMRAWVLSAAEWSELKARARDRTLVAVRMTTMEGQESGAATGPMSVGFLPRVQHGKFNLRVRAVWAGDTKSDSNSAGTASGWTTITNFALACRALIPNGGALVVDGGKSPVAGGAQATNYWFTLSAVAIDSKGNPKK